jgi:hypothetical protein
MSNDAHTPRPDSWAWTLRWPPAPDGRWMQLAPEQLRQSINPGWSFGNVIVNHANSSAPEVEQAVLSRFSYGRQIGRLMDAMEAVVAALPQTHETQAVQDFRQLAREVCALKQESRAQRLQRLRAELRELRDSDPQAWKALMKNGAA